MRQQPDSARFTVRHLQRLLKQIPQDKVTTYAELARALGSPKAHRAAGNLLNKNPDPDEYPCFRVVRSNGAIGGFARGTEDKLRRLRTAGIPVKNGKTIDLSAHKFVFPEK